jgi:adenosylhomocysteine nucleosidase
MLLIVAALAEELETALNLCPVKRKVRRGGVPVWLGERAGETIGLLKLGIGPVRSADTLERALAVLPATQILLIGYGGALDPTLKYGELVVVERAHLPSDESWGSALEALELGSSWPLADAEELTAIARAAGLPACCGMALTVPCIIGAPAHKSILFRKFQTAIVDMETAALARIAAGAGVAMSCARAVSDEAQDDYLAPFSYAPGAGSVQRTAKALSSGHWMRRLGCWRERSRAARQNLGKFLACYLDRKIR